MVARLLPAGREGGGEGGAATRNVHGHRVSSLWCFYACVPLWPKVAADGSGPRIGFRCWLCATYAAGRRRCELRCRLDRFLCSKLVGDLTNTLSAGLEAAPCRPGAESS